MKAKVIIDDDFLKKNCFLFIGSKVRIERQRGIYFDCITMAGKKVTLRQDEIKLIKLRKINNHES